ncbi:MAG: C39 family peptidase [Patescibacteria group bacterium]|jgi:hypothetical protein
MKKYILLILVFVLIGGAFFAYQHRSGIREYIDELFTEEVPAVSYSALNTTNTSNPSPTNTTNAPQNTNSAPTIPVTFNLDVPFTTQAPHANWDFPYQEACEEASALTVHYYYEGDTFTPDIADREILDLVEWENDHFGSYKDTTADETAEFIRLYFGYERVDVIANPTVLQIKQFVAAGHPVIVPAAGKQLGNPNFKNGGPLYHMFVVRGYTKDEFITNDVGTRKGENYRYDIDVVMNAMHDWNGGDVDSGRKAVVVVYPND